MGRKELLLALALLFLLGVGATAARLLEARRTGLSLRLQVFIPLAATTLLLSAMFAVIVIDRFTARAELFAFRAAEDEARAIAELAERTPQDALRPILSAFTRTARDTDVALLDAEGNVVLESGAAEANVAPGSAGGAGVGAFRGGGPAGAEDPGGGDPRLGGGAQGGRGGRAGDRASVRAAHPRKRRQAAAAHAGSAVAGPAGGARDRAEGRAGGSV